MKRSMALRLCNAYVRQAKQFILFPFEYKKKLDESDEELLQLAIAEMRELGIGFAWMQPGTYDDNLINDIQSLGITPIKDCVLIVSKEL